MQNLAIGINSMTVQHTQEQVDSTSSPNGIQNLLRIYIQLIIAKPN